MSVKHPSRVTQVSSANVVDFPERKSAPSAKQHTRDLFAWYRQVCRDSNLEKSDFKIAFVIGDHVNRASGEAWPSLKTIAEESAAKKDTVIAAVRRLTGEGHLAVDPGSAGSGNSNHYRTILKVQPADRLQEPERSSGQARKVQPAGAKGPASGPEPLKNHLEPHKSAPSGARTCYVDTDEDNIEQMIDRYRRERASGALNDHNDPDFIDLEPTPRWSGHPTTTVAASS